MTAFNEPLSEERLYELHELATASLNEELTDEQVVRLDRLVCEDEEFRRVYIRYMYVSWNLRTWAKFPLSDTTEDQLQPLPPDADAALLEHLADSQGGETLRLPAFGLQESAWPERSGFFFQGVPLAYLVASVIFAIGLLIGSLVPISHPVQLAKDASRLELGGEAARTIVGRITGMADCQWSPEARPPYGYDFVAVGRQFQLDSGLLEIAYDSGATVILEGPATYTVESPTGGFLAVGKLTARVEKGEAVRSTEYEVRSMKQQVVDPQSLIPDPSLPTTHYPLFIVKTPTAIVTDLGTEFGVEVTREGTTTSHVFRGTVELRAVLARGETAGQPRLLCANESARVEQKQAGASEPQIVSASADEISASFVREIPKPSMTALDLVDLASGGDGFSGRKDRGIDPVTGKACDSQPPPVLDVKDYAVGDRVYHRTEALLGVDGVFIPDGSQGAVTVDSAGHQFAEFPVTSNRTAGMIWMGGALHFDPPFEDIRTVMNGIDFASPGHAVLYLQSNQGITFDLDALRRANPSYKIVRFRATAGNTEPASERGEAVYADLWVLVDGQMRFRRREICGLSGVFSIVVPLSDTDRFLTLASTDGGNGIAWDQIIFGDPRVEMTPTKIRQVTSPEAKGSEERR